MLKRIFLLCLLAVFAASPALALEFTTNTFYSAYNPTSATYIYDESAGAAATDGQFDVRDYSQKFCQIGVPTLGSTSIDVRAEGRTKDTTTWSNIWTTNIAAATTIDTALNITEAIHFLRFGLKVNTNGTDSVNIYCSFAK